MCNVIADTSKVAESLHPQRTSGGQDYYYSLDVDVILLFGLTELKAQISWIHEVRLVITPVSSKLCHSHSAQGVEKRYDPCSGVG